jgi:acyl-CoA thioesterase
VGVIGLLSLWLRDWLPVDLLSSWGERLVGVMLFGIGLWALRRALKHNVHAHEHEHDGDMHVHLHTHGHTQATHHDRNDAHQHTHAAFGIGILHGLLNGHDICHGGLIATLADSTFAFACNSYNELTVASGFAIDLLAPGRLDDVLTATCTEVSKAGRTGVYDTEVLNQRGERIAVFRGRSYTIKGKPAVAG